MSSNEYVLQSCPQFVKGYCRNAPNCDAYHPMPTRDVQTVLREMSQIGADHSQGRYFCQFCQVLAQGDFYAMVGTVSRYRYCNLCGVFYFFPQVQELVRLLLDSARGDYLAFRRQVCECRGRLPALLQIPFTYEAHKWATARFAWTLCGPTQATQVLELLFRQQPFQRVLSMGAGTGYVEHVFNGASQSMRRPLEFLAFDQTPVGPGDYSVKVQRGGPEAFARLGDLSLSILLLCWPPFGSQQNKESTMASDCLKMFAQCGGRYLVYIGDVTATGDWLFHEMLYSEWELFQDIFNFTPIENWVPKEMGMLYAGCDSVGVYKMRDQPLQLPPVKWTLAP